MFKVRWSKHIINKLTLTGHILLVRRKLLVLTTWAGIIITTDWTTDVPLRDTTNSEREQRLSQRNSFAIGSG